MTVLYTYNFIESTSIADSFSLSIVSFQSPQQPLFGAAGTSTTDFVFMQVRARKRQEKLITEQEPKPTCALLDVTAGFKLFKRNVA